MMQEWTHHNPGVLAPRTAGPSTSLNAASEEGDHIREKFHSWHCGSHDNRFCGSVLLFRLRVCPRGDGRQANADGDVFREEGPPRASEQASTEARRFAIP